MKYRIEISNDKLLKLGVWIRPSEVDPSFHDFEPSLDSAIRAARFYQNLFGFSTRRTPLES